MKLALKMCNFLCYFRTKIDEKVMKSMSNRHESAKNRSYVENTSRNDLSPNS